MNPVSIRDCNLITLNKMRKSIIRKCLAPGCDRVFGSYFRKMCELHTQEIQRNGSLGKKKRIRTGTRDDHPLYRTYFHMKERCYKKNTKNYSVYGGRGIRVCDRWLGLNGFDHFILDMGEKPSRSSLDRIDVNGDYCKENCRWASAHQQAANKQNKSNCVGVTFQKSRGTWYAHLLVNRKYVLCKTFHTYEEAVYARKRVESLFGITYGDLAKEGPTP